MSPCQGPSISHEMQVLKLALTDRCLLDCRYCFVRKGDRVLSAGDCIRIIEVFLGSPGTDKMLLLYGGEPLLSFPLVKKVVLFALDRSKLLKKKLTISVATNGILLKEAQLRFFRDFRVKLCISMDGPEPVHDYARVFPDGVGTFRRVAGKIPLISRYICNRDFCALCGVLPRFAPRMHVNLMYLVKCGFQNINIEPIRSGKTIWTPRSCEIFADRMVRFLKYLYGEIERGAFVFLNTINRELKNRRVSQRRNACPFFESVEVSPDGRMFFSPFLANAVDRDTYAVGDVREGFRQEYYSCRFSSSGLACWLCRQGDGNLSPGPACSATRVLEIRDYFSRRAAGLILRYGARRPVFRRYIREARKRVFD